MSPRASNVILWLTFAATAFGAGAFFLLRLYRGLSVDLGFALAGLLARTALFVELGLFLEALLLRGAGGYLAATKKRRAVLHANWVCVMLVCLAIAADVLVFAFAGYHLTTATRILFSDGPSGVGDVIEATGLSPKLVAAAAVGSLLALAAAAWLSKLTRRASNRLGLEVTRSGALRGSFVTFGALAAVELLGYRFHNPFLWDRELQSIPLAFSVARPAAELASFRVALKMPAPASERLRAVRVAKAPNLPDIFIVVAESLRKDAMAPEVMPRLYEFGQSAWTFEHAQTAGNVTHYSWYGLFCAQIPLFFDVAKVSSSEHGSVPLAALRELGYRVRLFATPNTEYQNLESIVFGDGGALLDEKYHPPHPAPAVRDRMVVDEVARRLAAEPPGGNAYLIALDSTHFEYGWDDAFSPPFAPYDKSPSIARNYAVNAAARRELFQRYKSSAAWVDSLLGRLFEALRASGRLERSIIVVTGDHGEAFWEHGSGTHGSDLSQEQIEVAFALRLPGEPARHFDGVLSLMDVMPTVLHHLGADDPALTAGTALQRRGASVGAEGAGKAGGAALAPGIALTFQGWNSRAFQFVMTRGGQRLRLELDHRDPLQARRLVLKDVLDLRDTSLVAVDDGAVAGAYQRILRDLPAILDGMPFLGF